MKLLVDQLNDVDIVRLPARLAMADAPGARKAIRQLVDAGRKHIVLDLAKVTFVDSSGLSVLVSAMDATRAAGGDVVLLKPSPTVRSLIELTRLQQVFEIYGHEGRAVERLQSKIAA